LALEKEYGRAIFTWSSELETEIESAAKRLGEIKMEISQLLEFQKLGNVILDLQKQKTLLSAELSELNTNIEKFKFAQESRKKEAKLAIASELINLLHLDIPREDEFIKANDVAWEFGDNHVSVNNKLNFSESSMVILRHSFHLALLLASAKKEYFRIPRFLILDGIEDGGLERARSYHLQRLIIDVSKNLNTQHQIIFGTSQIDPELDHKDFVIGRSFTKDQKSLAIG
jgi:regulator of replication initiation timing